MLNKAQVSAYIESTEREKFAEIAKKQGRSTSELIREFIQKEIKKKKWVAK